MPEIHASAVIDPAAEIHDDAVVGPHCVVSGRVALAAGVRLMGGCYVEGPATIGERTSVYPGTAIGLPPQDFKFAPGSPTAGVVIGEGCVLREHVTIHAASNTETPTTLGDGCYLMVGSHMGHDVRVGNRVILTNHAVVGGHGSVGDGAVLSAHTAVHQHTRVGRLVMISGCVPVSMDVPPFCLVDGVNTIAAVNVVGLRRSGAPPESIAAVRNAFRVVLRRSLPRDEAAAKLRELGADEPMVLEMAEFVETTKRGICHGRDRSTRRR
ncbi:MAG: acyl-ACP--UDP-N-acetylglucosamine O-acyltransferase [Planctomycetota bacterium]